MYQHAGMSECEDRQKTLLDESPLGFFIIQDGVFVYVNSAMANIYGYVPEEIMGKERTALVHEDDREQYEKDMSVLVGTVGRSIMTRCSAVRKDGNRIFTETVCWSSSYNDRPSIAGSVTDISERRMSEESRKEAERSLRTILDSVYDAVFIHDVYGSILGVNEKMLEMFGVGRAEAMEFSITDDYSSPDIQGYRLTEEWERVLGGEDRFFEWKARRPHDGSVFHVEMYLRKVSFWGSDVILASVRDISKRKQAEAERSDMYHMMTHDIKGPLSIIYGYGDIISSMVDNPEVLDMVEEVKKAANRISAQVSDMLDISKLEYGEANIIPEPVDINALLREVAGQHALPSSECGVEIFLDIDKGIPEVQADPGQLMRAVGNLVSNAVVYCGMGCIVTVRSGISQAHPGNMFIEVSDTGAGIPKEDVPFIFDKYYRSSRTYKKKGTGLGLAIVKAVAESHGGSVELESEEGAGSTFRILLPVG